jgi:hypothetical protein
MTIWSAFTLSIYLNLIYLFLLRDINNNNNNLFLRSRPSQTPNWCMRPPPPSDLTGKVYRGIHTLPHSGFELQLDIDSIYPSCNTNKDPWVGFFKYTNGIFFTGNYAKGRNILGSFVRPGWHLFVSGADKRSRALVTGWKPSINCNQSRIAGTSSISLVHSKEPHKDLVLINVYGPSHLRKDL